MSIGWISLHREIQNHWLWQEKREFSKLEAWFDILLTVNHSEQKLLIKNTLFIVKRGESIKSLDTWAYRWNWNKSKVRRFLKMLEDDEMIVTKNERKTTRLTVCKYDSYQDMRNADETIMKHKRNANETQMAPNNNDINNDINNTTKAEVTFNHSNIDNFKQQLATNLHEHQQWLDSCYMTLGLRKNTISDLIDKYKSHLIGFNLPTKKDMQDFKTHFRSWLLLEDKNNKLVNYKKK